MAAANVQVVNRSTKIAVAQSHQPRLNFKTRNKGLYRKIWMTWSEKTSLHGIPDFMENYGCAWKTFWIICIIAGLSMVVRSLVQLMNDFSTSPTSIQLHKITSRNLTLPDLNICLQQGFNLSRLSMMGLNDSLINGIIANSGNELLNFPPFIATISYEQKMKWLQEYKTFKSENNNVSLKHIIRASSIDCDKLFISCVTNTNSNYSCCKDVDEVYHSHGKCFTLKNIGHQTYPGAGAGTKVAMNLSFQKTDIALIGMGQGIQLEAVHPGHVTNYNYVSIPINTVTDVILSYKHSLVENDPYKSPYCREFDEDQTRNRDTYSMNSCIRKAFGKTMQAICGCEEYYTADKDENVCDLYEFQANCLSNISYTDFLNKVVDNQANCLPACDTHSYTLTVSFGHFDTNYFSSALSKYQIATNVSNDKNSTFYDGNYILLNVHYNEMIYEESREVFIYSVDSFISNIGGILGLWLGASVLSIFQVIAYCFRCIVVKLGNDSMT